MNFSVCKFHIAHASNKERSESCVHDTSIFYIRYHADNTCSVVKVPNWAWHFNSSFEYDILKVTCFSQTCSDIHILGVYGGEFMPFQIGSRFWSMGHFIYTGYVMKISTQSVSQSILTFTVRWARSSMWHPAPASFTISALVRFS